MFNKPLISCEIGTATSFININNKTGFVVKPKSAKSIEFALKKIYSRTFNQMKFKKTHKKDLKDILLKIKWLTNILIFINL